MKTIEIITNLVDVKTLLERWHDLGEVPEIERDIALSKLRKVYDVIQNREFICENFIDTLEDELYDEEALDYQAPKQQQAEEEILYHHAPEQDDSETIFPTDDHQDQTPENPYDTSTLKIFNQTITAQERKRFVDELFLGDEELFDRSVEKIEQAPSFEEALIYISENHSWSAESFAADDFVAMISNGKR